MPKYILNAQILRGKCLTYPGTSANKLNTFVCFRVQGHQYYYKTKIKKNTDNPEWNEFFNVPIYNFPTDNLLITIIYRNANSENDLCDPYELSLNSIQVNSSKFSEFDLQLTKKGHPVGHLIIRLNIIQSITIPQEIGEYKLEFRLSGAINNPVYLAFKKGKNEKFSLKFSTDCNLHKEFTIMQQINHENILKSLEFFDMGNFYCYSMPFAYGDDLLVFISPLMKNKLFINENRIRFIMEQVLTAVSHLHSLNIIHRDIKPENFFFIDLNKTQLKLADFGFACQNEPDKEKLGTPAYMAPELLEMKPCLYFYC